MNPAIKFRRCQSADLPACASLASDAFPLRTGRFTGEEANKMMKISIDGAYALSNYHEIAIAGSKVAGLLFGQVKRKPVLIEMCRTLKQLFLIKVRFLLGRYGSRRKLIRIIRPGLQELRLMRRNTPASEAGVVLFAVAPEYQGIGIGRSLMDHFVHHASRYKVNAVSVPTDETASFWFYEKYGFRRWAEYKGPLESYLADRPITCFTYLLALREAGGQENVGNK